MKNSFLFAIIFLFSACSNNDRKNDSNSMITKGQMPSVTVDGSGICYIAYGLGDSIMCLRSKDDGKTFATPEVVSVLPGLVAAHMRGPQIAATKNGLSILAVTNAGDIFSFSKNNNEGWIKGARINDVDTVAKEGFLSLSADGENVFAVWLDLRYNQQNKIYGAGSIDGGKTWSANQMIYTSPDTTVCECCKPSVLVKNSQVYVMFRNWLQGNRDMYVVKSVDGGKHFELAQQLGTGHWKLDGCPMDGGGMAVNKAGDLQTVWRREKNIYSAASGAAETPIGEGKGCTIEMINDHPIYAWNENGNIVLQQESGTKRNIGKGQLPVVKALDDKHVICVWEDDKQIHRSVITL